jgi:acetyltransferase-like isoleucine patch superfamily enzyme
MSDVEYAREKGVTFGNRAKFYTRNFGSEPYLIKLGDDVELSGGVSFINHDGAVDVLINLFDDCQKIDLCKPIIIENNVFVGLNTVILPGTHIESDVIVGAGSIVRGRLDSGYVYAGVPIKKICSINEYKDKNMNDFDKTKGMPFIEKKAFYLNKYQEILR